MSASATPAPLIPAPSASHDPDPAGSTAPVLTLAALPSWLTRGALLVDVREEEERELFGSLPGALPLPLLALRTVLGLPLSGPEREIAGFADPALITARLEALRRSRTSLICFCAHGRRARSAAGLLRRLGHPALALATDFTALRAALPPAPPACG